MSDNTDKIVQTVNSHTRSLVPFTGGLLFVIYAWFWPESYGHWLGTIVHAFRAASGI